MEIMKLIGRGIAAAGIIFTCVLLAGCQSGTKPQNDGYGYDPLGKDKDTAAMDANSGLPGSDLTRPGGGPAASDSDTNGGTAILQVGDVVTVIFNDVPSPPSPMQDQIKEDGTVTLYYNEKFAASGKSIHQLQVEIHDRYVPTYFKHMTPSVATADRFYSVGGEVRNPNRYVWTPGMTVLRAIDSAGGFTDFSNKGSVAVTRANTRKREVEDCKKALKNPEKDLPVYPGDQVFVKKRIL
jgi:protein involved in polysaccharide export with SLBB domain